MMLDFEPKTVMKYFEEICAIPHGSGNTKTISNYLMEFAKLHGLKARQDEMNNVIIWKKATKDKVGCDEVILQGHIDMVSVKEAGCTKNLETEGLDLVVSDGFISAQGTSLGGDDGIAVAYALAVLAADDISHPDIVAVFTVDEEIGMLGAAGIDLSDVRGKMLLNMDSEDEGIFLVSCAGGATAECVIPVLRSKISGTAYDVTFAGFKGGHSGVEIDKGRANTNILLGRMLMELADIMPFGIVTLNGGEKDNAIAKISRAEIVVFDECTDMFEQYVDGFEKTIISEYSGVEDAISIKAEKIGQGNYESVDQNGMNSICLAINYIPNGIQKMSANIEGLVQTSLNLGKLTLTKERATMTYSVRSSVGSEKAFLLNKIKTLVEFLGGTVDISGDYPAWEYKEDSKLRDTMIISYEKLFGTTPKLEAIHAGVECGILAGKIEGLDCVSFGPQIYDIHTTDERMDIASVERTWKLIIDVLKNI